MRYNCQLIEKGSFCYKKGLKKKLFLFLHFLTFFVQMCRICTDLVTLQEDQDLSTMEHLAFLRNHGFQCNPQLLLKMRYF